MDESQPVSALRIDLRPREWALWQGLIHRIERLIGEHVRIRDANSTELHEVPVAELRGVARMPAAEMARRLEQQRTAPDGDRLLARRREEAIPELLKGEGAQTARVAKAAQALGVCDRTVQRMVRRYATSAQISSLLPHRRGPNRNRPRLVVSVRRTHSGR